MTLNVFMCTGFTRDTGQYFAKALRCAPATIWKFFAEIDLIGGLSACPGGDCGSEQPATPPPATRCWSRSLPRRAQAAAGP